MKIKENIHFIECPFRQSFTGVVAILDKSVTLIDTGLTNSPTDTIFPYLNRIGRRAHEISNIILTHAHYDHANGVSAIKKSAKPKIAIHKSDKPILENANLFKTQLLNAGYPKEFVENKPPINPTKADITLEDGEKIRINNQEFDIMHTPGHSAGSICIVIKKQGIYITGDSVQYSARAGYIATEGNPLIFHSTTEYKESMNRLLHEPIKILIGGHPFPPLKRGILYGTEAKTLIRDSINILEHQRKKVLELIEQNTKNYDIKKIYASAPSSNIFTIGCIIKELLKGK